MASYVQIITKWNEQEPTFTFDISKFKHFFKNVKKIETISVLFCDVAAHQHFDNVPATSAYPSDVVYQEKIEIAVPRPQVLVHRRRTTYFLPTLELVEQPAYIRDYVLNRLRRSISRKKRSVLEPNEIEMTCFFNTINFARTIKDTSQHFVDLLVVKLEQACHGINGKYNHLLLGDYSIKTTELTEDNFRIIITLPAKTLIGVNCKNLFKVLGFTNKNAKMNETYFGLVNKTSLPISLEGTPIKYMTLSAMYIDYPHENLEPLNEADTLNFKFMSLNEKYSKKWTVTLNSECEQSSLE